MLSDTSVNVFCRPPPIALTRRDDRDRDAGDEKSVFDRGRPAFVPQKTFEHSHRAHPADEPPYPGRHYAADGKGSVMPWSRHSRA
jgi:hypothetical protein